MYWFLPDSNRAAFSGSHTPAGGFGMTYPSKTQILLCTAIAATPRLELAA